MNNEFWEIYACFILKRQFDFFKNGWEDFLITHFSKIFIQNIVIIYNILLYSWQKNNLLFSLSYEWWNQNNYQLS